MGGGTAQVSTNAATKRLVAARAAGTQDRTGEAIGGKVPPGIAERSARHLQQDHRANCPAFSASIAALSGGLALMGTPVTANVSHAAKQSAKASTVTSGARSATRWDRRGRVHRQTFPFSCGMIGSGPSISGSSGKWARASAAFSA